MYPPDRSPPLPPSLPIPTIHVLCFSGSLIIFLVESKRSVCVVSVCVVEARCIADLRHQCF